MAENWELDAYGKTRSTPAGSFRSLMDKFYLSEKLVEVLYPVLDVVYGYLPSVLPRQNL